MPRTVHLLGEGGRAACCGKTPAVLGLGAILTDDPAAVTCPAYEMPGFEEELVENHIHPIEGPTFPKTDSAYAELEEQLIGLNTLRLREGDQPLPKVNSEPDVQSQLIKEIEGRRRLGIQRYGTALQPFNDRDALRDLLDELLDGATYALQVQLERDALLTKIADLEAQIAFLKEERQS